MTPEYDLIVVGGGPAGYAGAIRAAQLGMKTAVVEAERVGGICVNWGCIPSKVLLHCAEIYDIARTTTGRVDCGIRADAIRWDYRAVYEKSRQAADRLARAIEARFRDHQIELITGRGRLADGQTVIVSAPQPGLPERTLRGRRILLATGARAHVLPGMKIDGKRLITSREALAMRTVPKTIIIIGAGAVGLEFASIWASSGAKVTLIELEPRFPPVADDDLASELQKALTRRGINFLIGMACHQVELTETGVRGIAVSPTSEQRVEADMMLVAIGVVANSENLGLESLGIPRDRGFVRTGPGFRTNCETVWAAGDLIGAPLLAHAATAEAIAAVEWMVGQGTGTIPYNAVPACIYCQPEVGWVGWTEKRARAERANVGVAKVPFVVNGKAVATGDTDGFIKLVYDSTSGEILGCHMIGAGTTELINTFGLAISAGLTVEQVGRAIYAHPTRAEVIGEAALVALKRAITVQ